MENKELSPQLGCVVLAAGSARRFGADKLLAHFDGQTLLQRALAAVPAEAFARTVLVTQGTRGAAEAEALGFAVVCNDAPERGASRSVQLGLAALGRCDAALFMVADQPLLRRETVARLAAFARQHPHNIVALAHAGQRGNPCVFPACFFAELAALTGDVGGGAVIRRHPERLLLLEVDAAELADADTPEALAALAPL